MFKHELNIREAAINLHANKSFLDELLEACAIKVCRKKEKDEKDEPENSQYL